MKVVVECGQRWWRWRSWVPYRYPKTGRDWSHFFRRIDHKWAIGFAVGPIICTYKEKSHEDR